MRCEGGLAGEFEPEPCWSPGHRHYVARGPAPPTAGLAAGLHLALKLAADLGGQHVAARDLGVRQLRPGVGEGCAGGVGFALAVGKLVAGELFLLVLRANSRTPEA